MRPKKSHFSLVQKSVDEFFSLLLIDIYTVFFENFKRLIFQIKKNYYKFKEIL